MPHPPKRAQFIHDRYLAQGLLEPRVVSAEDARAAWGAADEVVGTAEFGFQTIMRTDRGAPLARTFTPMTNYPLPARLAECAEAVVAAVPRG